MAELPTDQEAKLRGLGRSSRSGSCRHSTMPLAYRNGLQGICQPKLNWELCGRAGGLADEARILPGDAEVTQSGLTWAKLPPAGRIPRPERQCGWRIPPPVTPAFPPNGYGIARMIGNVWDGIGRRPGIRPSIRARLLRRSLLTFEKPARAARAPTLRTPDTQCGKFQERFIKAARTLRARRPKNY